MTPAEARAYNAGVAAVLDIARRTAETIGRTSKRHVHEDFAVAALDEIAVASHALLVPIGPADSTIDDRQSFNKLVDLGRIGS